ncbi:GATOR complex protein WDR24 [Lutzomyia longipalpis]|uniref:GATOR complex protein WDR24 n=1 Tax=Lutzomyia longipalpis TaxID=7200 RepID=UPI0024844FA5|nr:GATOR complex protein WDR24 [Lutzomyia longipalpis]
MENSSTVSLRICQEGHANALALNKDCTQIAVAGRSLLKVFSIEAEKFVEVCNMRGGKNQNLSYSSNDVAWSYLEQNILATAATNGVVSVWDLSRFGRHKQLLVYNEHERTAHSVMFHPTEANLLISGSQDGTIKCFDTRNDKGAVMTYFSNSESVRDVKFSPHNPNTFAAVSENGTVQIWDIRKPEKCTNQFTAHSGPIYTCDWHPTQQWLATGSRDKQIKIWNMGSKATLEHTIHTIAVVGRVKWRPDKMYHIASCALVVDYSIYIWDVRRPYIPYASFNEHTNVTTGIGWKGSDPYVLLSTSKDSTIYKHAFKDAHRPSMRANPQGASVNYRGDLLYAYKTKVPPPITASNSKTSLISSRPKQPTKTDHFHLAKSNLQNFISKSDQGNFTKDVSHLSPLREFLCLKGCAREYKLMGKSLADLCEHNINVAKKYGKVHVAMLWMWVKNLYAFSMSSNVKSEPRTSTSGSNLLGSRLMSQTSNQSTNVWEEIIGSRDDDESIGLKADDQNAMEQKTGELFSSTHTRIAYPPVNDGESDMSFNDFIFGDQELTIEHMDCVKNLRNGFLYVGPHFCKEWSLPNSPLIGSDLHAAKHETPPESSQETTPPPHPPNLIKMSFMPYVPLWEPHDVLADCLILQADIGDVQTAVSILIALGEKRNELPIDKIIHENWLLAYIDLLHRHQMWNEAAEIMNLSWIPNICMLNEQSTAVYTNCGICGKHLTNKWHCTKCRSSDASKCSVCNTIVRGLYAWCQGCSHGGHLEHLKQWFTVHSRCPICGHLCEYE